MSWFGFDAASIAARAAQAPGKPVPTLRDSVLRGTVGFTAVSVAGFIPWAVFERPLHHYVGEAGMYIACAAVFIGLSAPALHGLIAGGQSLGRFYKLFSLAFGAYSVAWILGWMLLKGDPGSIAGLLAGTLAMGFILCQAFDAMRALIPVVAALFLLNSAGYFGGGWVEGAIMHWGAEGKAGRGSPQMIAAMLSWGVCYGLGLGAGLGLAFYLCQDQARRLIAETKISSESAG